jgi:hypothetical protein
LRETVGTSDVGGHWTDLNRPCNQPALTPLGRASRRKPISKPSTARVEPFRRWPRWLVGRAHAHHDAEAKSLVLCGPLPRCVAHYPRPPESSRMRPPHWKHLNGVRPGGLPHQWRPAPSLATPAPSCPNSPGGRSCLWAVESPHLRGFGDVRSGDRIVRWS